MAESFFQLLKRERIKRKVCTTRIDARADVFDSIGNDSLQIQPSIAHLSGEQLANQVVNFDLVRAVSRSGGTDTVTGSSLADYVLQLNGNWLGS